MVSLLALLLAAACSRPPEARWDATLDDRDRPSRGRDAGMDEAGLPEEGWGDEDLDLPPLPHLPDAGAAADARRRDPGPCVCGPEARWACAAR